MRSKRLLKVYAPSQLRQVITIQKLLAGQHTASPAVGTGTFQGEPGKSLTDIILNRLGDVPPGEGNQQFRLLSQVIHDDLINFGFIPEFANRFSHLIVLAGPDKAAFTQIIRMPNGPLSTYTEVFGLHGIELVFDDAAVDILADKAFRAGIGARVIADAADVCLRLINKLPEYGKAGAAKVIVTREVVTEAAEPRIEKAGKRKDQVIRPANSDGVSITKTTEDCPTGISRSENWSEAMVAARMRDVKKAICYGALRGTARDWWESFIDENQDSPRQVLRLMEELMVRKATAMSFFMAYAYSGVKSIPANLHYYDYKRLKDEEQRKRRVKGPAACGEGDNILPPGPAGRNNTKMGGVFLDDDEDDDEDDEESPFYDDDIR